MVAGNHAHGDAGSLRGGDGVFSFGAQRIGNRHEAVKSNRLARRQSFERLKRLFQCRVSQRDDAKTEAGQAVQLGDSLLALAFGQAAAFNQLLGRAF